MTGGMGALRVWIAVAALCSACALIGAGGVAMARTYAPCTTEGGTEVCGFSASVTVDGQACGSTVYLCPGSHVFSITASDCDYYADPNCDRVQTDFHYQWKKGDTTVSTSSDYTGDFGVGTHTLTWAVRDPAQGETGWEDQTNDPNDQSPPSNGAWDKAGTITVIVDPVHEVTFLEPSDGATIGGTKPVRVRVKTRCASVTSLVLKEHEVTDVHTWDWATFSGATVESTETDPATKITTTVYKWEWATVSVHNGPHLLRAEVDFAVVGADPVQETKERSVNVKNLVVSATPEFLIYRPDDENPANTISYTLADTPADDPDDNETQVTIAIYTSEQEQVKSETVTQTAPGSYSYVWDGKDSGGNLMEKGIYLYRISASQPTQGDSDCEKSDWDITSTLASTIDRNESTGAAVMRMRYRMATEGGCDATQATSAKLRVYDPDLAKVEDTDAQNPIQVNQDAFFPDFDLQLNHPTGGDYVFLVSGKDKHPAHDRNHADRDGGVRPLLQNNDRCLLDFIVAFLDAGHGGGDPGTTGTPRYSSWDEREANEWVRLALELELTYGHSCGSCGMSLEQCLWKRYCVLEVPRIERKERAKFAQDYLIKWRPPHGVFLSLHCNAPSTSSRLTQAWFHPSITDSGAMADALLAELGTLGLGRRYERMQADTNRKDPKDRLYLLRDLASMKPADRMPCNLLEMVMLTNEEDEDWIHNASSLFANRIHKSFCNFDFHEIQYWF